MEASNTHLGTVLQQLLDGSCALVVFYSAFDRELMAAYSSLPHFKFMLEGRDFTIFTLTSLSPMLCLEFLCAGPPSAA